MTVPGILLGRRAAFIAVGAVLAVALGLAFWTFGPASRADNRLGESSLKMWRAGKPPLGMTVV